MNNRPPAVPARESRFRAIADAVVSRMDRTKGLEEPALLKQLVKQLGATKALVATWEGRITEVRYVPDNSARHRALDTAFTLRGAYPATKIDVTAKVRVEEVAVLVQAAGLDRLTPDQLRAAISELDAVEDLPALEGEVVREEES